MKGDQLTPKQERFCLNLFSGMSQRVAWIEAGYSSKYPPKIIDENSCRLAAENKIKARMTELKAKAEDATIATVLERKQRLTSILRANLVDFQDDNGNVKFDQAIPGHVAVSEYSVTTIGHDEGEVVMSKKLKLRDPISAIAELNKMEHIYETDKSGQTINNTQYNIIVESAGAEDMLKRLKSGERTQKELPGGNGNTG